MNAILRWLRFLAIGLQDFLLLLCVKKGNENSRAIVKLDAIGDFILWLDAAKEYAKIYGGKNIVLVANSAWAQLARELPYWTDVLAIDVQRLHKRPVYRWRTLRSIRKAGFQIVIQPTFSRVFLLGDSVVRATGAEQRVGSTGDCANIRPLLKAVSDRWYTQLLPATEKDGMELDRNAEFMAGLAHKPFQADLPKLPLHLPLPPHLQPSGAYFIAFPGAAWHGRQWPLSHFSSVIAALQRRYGWLPVVCGSSDEYALCQKLAERSNAAVLNLAGQTSLAELAQLIRGAQILIGNETSAIHMAAAVGTPSVCILGGGHYGRFLPYPERLVGLKPRPAVHAMDCFHCNWNCNQAHDPSGPVPCISGVSVEAVLHLVELELQSASAPARVVDWPLDAV